MIIKWKQQHINNACAPTCIAMLLTQHNIQKEDFYELHYTRNNLHFVSEYITNTENDSGMVYLWILTNNLRNEILGIPKFREDLLPLIELFL